jgi:hypothetical protein
MFWRVMDWFDKTLDRMRDIFSDFRELSERIVPNPTATSTSDLHVPKEVVCPPDPHSTLQGTIKSFSFCFVLDFSTDLIVIL